MKQYLVFYGAVDTYSGYGSRARDLVLSLIKSDKYDIEIISCRWGECSFGFLKQDNPDHKLILDRIVTGNQLKRQPDIWIMNTVPNEMQQVGKYNILITAGIETTICDPSWIDGCNRANLVLVSSNHAKTVFENSKFEEKDQQTNQLKRTVELKTPIEVLFEGVDIDIYKKLNILPNNEDIVECIDSINEDFCYLFVGHWLKGDIGQDRKDVGGLIRTFLETFRNTKNPPALILKTNGATCSIMDREEILTKIESIKDSISGELPNIYLLHGELTNEEMNVLYNHPKVKAMVSFTKGEGFGRPLLEFTLSQKPVIVSSWSGHIDFLSPETAILLPGTLTLIHKSAVQPNMLIEGSSWFTVNYKQAGKFLETFWKTSKNYVDLGKRQAYKSKIEFSLEKMADKLLSILNNKIPQITELKLPKITLPKLKTV